MSNKTPSPREAHANVFRLAKVGLDYLASLETLGKEQKELRDIGEASLRYFARKHEQSKKRSEQRCTECGKRDFQRMDDYMLRGDVWREAHPEGYNGLLHLDCLEYRLRRPLRKSDFTYCLSFTNRHLYDLTVEDWEKHTGVPMGLGLIASIERQTQYAQPYDYARIEQIKARA